jgi:hypothetical protein
MPKWKRKPAQEAKNRNPPNLEDGLQRFTGLWLDKKRHLQSENTWALCILMKINRNSKEIKNFLDITTY